MTTGRPARSPRDNARLANTYFSIQDNETKRAFLAANPDLFNWFVQQRTARYEGFLNQVAVYMGQNPELFQTYVTKQTDLFVRLGAPLRGVHAL